MASRTFDQISMVQQLLVVQSRRVSTVHSDSETKRYRYVTSMS